VHNPLLYSVGFWAAMAAAVGALLAAAGIGYRLGKRQGDGSEQERSQVSQLQSSVLGLLALLLGFTFAMAQGRYETRRELTADDANAISTAYLRAQTLSEPYRGRITGLLRQYVNVEVQVYLVSDDLDRLGEIRQQANRLQRELWAQAAGLAASEPRAVTTGLLLTALNDLIELHGKRVAALRSRVPFAIWRVLLFVGLAAMGLTGYACGRGGHRVWIAIVVVALVISSVAVVIVDLDRPVAGPTQISQQALLDARDSMQDPGVWPR
jgi:hypothetical protein